jgi:hypothetical protein
MALHRSTVEQWYERYVIPDRAPAREKPNNVSSGRSKIRAAEQ